MPSRFLQGSELANTNLKTASRLLMMALFMFGFGYCWCQYMTSHVR